MVEKDGDEGPIPVATKGNKRVTYPITAPIRDNIKQARAWKAERGIADKPHLFCNTRGAAWTSQSVGRRIMDSLAPIDDTTKKRKPKEGAPIITAHQFRHMAGTILGEKNVEVPRIMAALGHANPASTQVYVDKTQKMRNEAMDPLIKNLSKNDPETALSEIFLTDEKVRQVRRGLEIECPCCRRKFLIRIKKKAQPQ